MADEYVPIGGWEAAGYSGFSPAPVYQPPVQTAYTTPGAVYNAPAYAPQQQLVSPDSSYAQTRGWSPDPYAMNNSGPALVGGSWGGLMSRNALYPTTGGPMPTPAQTAQPAPASNPYGDLSGVPSNPYGDLSGVPAMSPPNPYGDLSGSQNFSVNPGGDYNDTFNIPYNNPYGDLSGVPQASINTAPQNPPQAYQMPTTASTYGDLSGSRNVATGGASLSGYQPQPTYASPAGGASLTPPPGALYRMGDDWIGANGQRLGTSYQPPAQAYQMPTTGSTFGDLSGVSRDPGPSPFSDLSGSQPSPVSTAFQPPAQGVQMPTTAATYGALPNTAATGGATLAGYQPQPTYASPAGGASLTAPPGALYRMGDDWIGADGKRISTVSTAFEAPATGVQMPRDSSPFGDLSGSFGAGFSRDIPAAIPPNTTAADLPLANAQPISANASSLLTGGAGLFGGPDNNPTYGDLSGVNPATMTRDYTGGAGLEGGTQTAFAGLWPSSVAYDGSNASAPDFNSLPQSVSPSIEQIGRDIGATQFASYPLDRSQVPPSIVERGTSIDELPFPNDAERMRLMRTVNGEDPRNPDAVLWSIKNRLATQQMPGQARYGNQIGAGTGSLNNGTDVVTRGNQYNAFSQAGYNADNFANNVAGFNETNPNYQTYSDAIDRVWSSPSSSDPTRGATNYYNPNTSQPAWQQQLAQQNNVSIGAHTYVGQTPLYSPPTPPSRPAYLDAYNMPSAYSGGDRSAMNQLVGVPWWGRR